MQSWGKFLCLRETLVFVLRPLTAWVKPHTLWGYFALFEITSKKKKKIPLQQHLVFLPKTGCHGFAKLTHKIYHCTNKQWFHWIDFWRSLGSSPADFPAGSCAVDTDVGPVQEEMKLGTRKFIHPVVFLIEFIILFCGHGSISLKFLVLCYCWRKLSDWLWKHQLRKGGKKKKAIFQGQECNWEGEEGRGIEIHTNKCTIGPRRSRVELQRWSTGL